MQITATMALWVLTVRTRVRNIDARYRIDAAARMGANIFLICVNGPHKNKLDPTDNTLDLQKASLKTTAQLKA